MPANVFQVIGLSDNRFKRASDYDLYIRIAAKFDVTVIKKRLVRWRRLSTSASGPANLRYFHYLPEDVGILRKCLRESDKNDRSLIRSIIKNKLSIGVERLYYYGRAEDKFFATRNLLKLLAGNLNFPVIVIFLIGLWRPNAITSNLSSVVRKLFLGNQQ